MAVRYIWWITNPQLIGRENISRPTYFISSPWFVSKQHENISAMMVRGDTYHGGRVILVDYKSTAHRVRKHFSTNLFYFLALVRVFTKQYENKAAMMVREDTYQGGRVILVDYKSPLNGKKHFLSLYFRITAPLPNVYSLI